MSALGQCLQRAQGELEQPQRRLPLHRGESFGGLGDGAGRGVAGIVTEEPLAVQVDPLDLADAVQRTAQLALGVTGELQVDVTEGFQPGAELRGGPAYPPGDRAQPAVSPGEQGDDPVRLAEFLHTQHHRVVAVELSAVPGHRVILPPRRSSGLHPGRISGSARGQRAESVQITAIRLLPGAGDVTVRADGGVDGVRIKRVVRYQGNQPQTTYEITGTELVLDTSCGNRCSVSYEVTAGEGGSVRGETGSGEVDLSRVGPVEVTVGAGDVRVAGAAGGVRVESGSGNIEVYDVTEPVVLRSGSGDITANRLEGEVDAEARSGNVTVELDRPASVRAHASSGNVDLTVPDGAYQVRSTVGSGTADVGVPHDPSATVVLDVATGSGDLAVTSR
ncbi:hypothetical protein D0Q02_19685 [Micromonospora craniellae]|uniref:DUF4097 domain-containing protein n=1 Tax=Micromonospora craniellae TaxID=2294034 RepID=A0A372FVS6_9ACTN|nr:hypothetical protein D0Q02_19685 [Micromonospora craniellae]